MSEKPKNILGKQSSKYLLLPVVIACAALLASCGGGSGIDSTSTAELANGTKEAFAVSGSSTVPGNGKDWAPTVLPTRAIVGTASPIDGLEGIAGNASDGTTIYLLRSVATATQTPLKIILSPAKTGGDPSNLVGKTFFEFSASSEDRAQVVVSSNDVRSVNECSLSEKTCTILPYGRTNAGIVFEIRLDSFYALEK